MASIFDCSPIYYSIADLYMDYNCQPFYCQIRTIKRWTLYQRYGIIIVTIEGENPVKHMGFHFLHSIRGCILTGIRAFYKELGGD